MPHSDATITEPSLPESEMTWCMEILPRVSRTFALSIAALPDSLREPVCLAYLLCRIVDTIEDQADLVPATRAALFDEFDLCLAQPQHDPSALEQLARTTGLDADGAGGELCTRAGIVFRRYRALDAAPREAIFGPVAEMSLGMREYCRRTDQEGSLGLRDLEDLDRYCYYVAGTVGKLLTALFELTLPELPHPVRDALRDRAVSFGLGLQLVNILKNVAEDLERGQFFLPRELMAAEGLVPHEMLDPNRRPAGLRVIRSVSARARQHLIRAREYTLLFPEESGSEPRLFCAVPLGLALATLVLVDQGDDTLVKGREPKLTRGSVNQLFGDIMSTVSSNGELGAVLDRCARGDYH